MSFGRGYVHLTWWYNYATAGVLPDKGLTLVTDPENAKVANIARLFEDVLWDARKTTS